MSVTVPSGYKQTKVGVIPEDWKIVRLGEVSKVKDGTHFSPQSTDGDFMYITSKNIKFGFLDLSNVSYISEDDHNTIFKACPVKKGQVLLTKDGANTGNACLNTIDKPFSLLSSVAYIDTYDNLNNNFLLQFFLSNTGQKKIQAEMAGQAITRLTLVKINALKIPLPPLKEQQKIAQILSTWDDAISKQEELIKAKEIFKKGLMQKLLSGEVRFAGFEGEREEVRLGDVATFYKGKGISKKDIAFDGLECIRYGELYTKYNERIEKIISKTSMKKEQLFLSKANDILIPASGETAIDLATASCILKSDIGLGGDINVIRTDANGIFLAYYLNVVAKIKIASLAQGVSVIHLYSSQLKNLKIKLPSLQEQQKIAQVLTTADKEIELLKKELEALKEQKHGLMQRLLSGEVRVKV